MIIVNTGINDGSLPSSQSLVAQLKAVPSLLSWHRCSPDNLNPGNTQEGAPIVDLANLTGRGGTFSNFSGGNSRPVFASGRLNGRPGIVFDGTNDFLVQFNTSWNLLGPWTMVAVYRADASKSALQTPLAAYDSSSVVSGILQNEDALSLRHGTADRTIPMVRGQNVFAMLSSDTAYIRARVNGAEYGPVPTNNVQPTNAPRIGSLHNGVNGNFRGPIMDVMFFTDDLLGHDRATAALVERYVTSARSYGFGFNPLRAR